MFVAYGRKETGVCFESLFDCMTVVPADSRCLLDPRLCITASRTCILLLYPRYDETVLSPLLPSCKAPVSNDPAI